MDYQPFTADNAAMLLIDYQTGTMQLIRDRSRDQVHRNGVLLARLAAGLHLPTGRRNLIIAGVTTDVCLIHPAVRAVVGGYQVQVVVDASGSNTAISEQIALQTMLHRTVAFGLLVLLLVAVSGTAALLLSISRTFGAMISTVILLTLGAASGGQLAAAFLPAWLAPLARVLPNGLAINAMRGAVYFHGASVGTAFLGLALWAVIPVAVIETLTRLRRHRTPVPGPTVTVSP